MKNQLKEYCRHINWRTIIKISVIIFIIMFAIFLSRKFSLLEIKIFIQENQNYSLLISLLIYIIFGLAFLPSVPLTLFIAVLIGPLQAAIIATFGNTAAAFFEYQIGKSVGEVVEFEQRKSKLPFGLDKLPIHSPFFMLVARGLPAGTRVYSLVCGAYQVPLTVYLWTTFVMFFINSAFLAFAGAKFIPFN